MHTTGHTVEGDWFLGLAVPGPRIFASWSASCRLLSKVEVFPIALPRRMTENLRPRRPSPSRYHGREASEEVPSSCPSREEDGLPVRNGRAEEPARWACRERGMGSEREGGSCRVGLGDWGLSRRKLKTSSSKRWRKASSSRRLVWILRLSFSFA